MAYESSLVINLATGQVTRVPLSPADVLARDADAAAAAAAPPPVDPAVEVVMLVVNAPDFDTAKANLAAYIARRKAA